MATTKKAQDYIGRLQATLEKKFGTQAVTRLGGAGHAQAAAQVREVIPTGIEVVDYYSLGIGGLPVGRVSEVAGEEGAGKTSFGYACLASAQRLGGTAVVLDPEYSFDEERARVYGVNVDDLLVFQPDSLEMACEQVKAALAMNDPKRGPMLLVWDSLAVTLPKAWQGMDAGERGVGEVARIMSAELPKMLPLLQAHRAHLLVLNQIREKIGVMFGDNKTTPGGRALKFYASWRAQFFGGKAGKDAHGEHTGKDVTLLTIKTRFTPPFRKARIRLDYARGWLNDWSTLEHAKRLGVVAARGAGTKGAKAHAAALAKLGWAPGGVAVVDAEQPVKDEEE